MTPQVLATCVMYGPREFAQLDGFYYDWSVVSPLRNPGWVRSMAAVVRAAGIILPTSWLGEASSAAEQLGSGTITATSRVEQEEDRLGEALATAIDESMASGTTTSRCNPALKAIWYLHTCGYAMPPTHLQVARYLMKISLERENIGSVAAAADAMGYLARLNSGGGWAPDLHRGYNGAPLAAARRRCAHATKKSRPVNAWMVRNILEIYVRQRWRRRTVARARCSPSRVPQGQRTHSLADLRSTAPPRRAPP